MHPEIHVNWLAVLSAVAASFFLGGIWYSPRFAKFWGQEKPPDASSCHGKGMAQAFGLNLFGTLLMAYVLAHSVAIWRPSTWGTGADQAPQVYGFFGGFFLWLGFVVPLNLNRVGFEKLGWRTFALHVSYQFVSLQAMAMILAFWR